MKRTEYEKIEKYMLSCMKDSAHDCLHIYRVLYLALEISNHEEDVDKDVLIASSLLHDIGREEQFKNPMICHAQYGSEMAYEYLIQNGWTEKKAQHVKECIASHRFRGNSTTQSIEAKILFDSDKLDATGALGIARCLIYEGLISEPIYTINQEGNVIDGENDGEQSFFREYHYKLKKLYDNFNTQRAKEIAAQRQAIAVNFYNCMLDEAVSTHAIGLQRLSAVLE